MSLPARLSWRRALNDEVGANSWAGIICTGFSYADRATASTPGVRCGYLYGAPRRVDGSSPLVLDPRSEWEQSLYVCASGVRAKVRRVDFSTNGGELSLDRLRIDGVSDLDYSDPTSLPVWAAEEVAMPVWTVDLAWGLVAPTYENAPGLLTRRAASFWLPPARRGITSDGDVFVAGLHQAAMTNVYTPIGGVTEPDAPSFSGQSNFAVFAKWQRLSASETTAPKIINLIWTDLIASATIGTKSILSASAAANDKGSSTPLVTAYGRRLNYNLVFAIPAIIVLSLWLFILCAALIFMAIRRFTFRHLTQLTNQTSVGRAVTDILYPELCEPGAKTSTWARTAGVVNLDLLNFRARAKNSERVPGPEEEEAAEASNREGGHMPLVVERLGSNSSVRE